MNKILLFTIFMVTVSCIFGQTPNQMIIGANNNGAIMSAMLDGTSPTEVNTGASDRSFYNAAYHTGNEKVYMSWYYGIYSMNVDGSNFDTLYSYPAGGMGYGIDIDESNGYIYFTHTPVDSIYRMDLNGANLTGIYGGTNVDYLNDVKLDLANGHIYFSEWILGNGLFRIDINGTNETTIVGGVDVEAFYLDVANNHIYYVYGTNLSRCDFNGSNNISLVSGFQLGGFDIDFSTNLIYMTDMSNDKVLSCDLLGVNLVELIQSTDILFNGTDQLEAPYGPVLVRNCTKDNNVNQNGVTLTANQIGAQYQWLDCGSNYSIINGETNQSYTSAITGNYAVEIIMNGCIDTSACFLLDYTGINEINNSTIKVYPNPTKASFNIELDENIIGSNYVIYDQLGKVVQNGVINNNPSQIINVAELSKGLYNLKIDNSDLQVKLIKE